MGRLVREKRLWTGFSTHRTTASDGGGTGSISFATPIQQAKRLIIRFLWRGVIETTWSTHSTPISLTISSCESRSPGTSWGARDRVTYMPGATATGYLAISRRFGFDSENYHHLTIQDTIDTVGQTVLGLSLGCARCHDHKFDPISMNDYYALYGIFDSSRYAFPGSEQKQQVRAMLPLLPPEESVSRWRGFYCA